MTLLPRLAPAIFALALPFMGGAALSQEGRQDAPVVVELFTSQGCSSCPRADEILHELSGRDDVIALALHVDYWDYIGWEDPYGDPQHAKRQRGYARVAGRRAVMTPEMIVQGQTAVAGAKPMKLSRAMATHAEAPAPVKLTLERRDDRLDVRAEVTPQAGADLAEGPPLNVHMLRYIPERTTTIERGENRGKTVIYANIVEDLQVLTDWDGQAPLSLTVPLEGARPVVVLVQEQGPGAILAAARLR